MARRTKPVDDVWALYQTRTVRQIAKELRVDRRTVQRWKNQGMQPTGPRDERLRVAASRLRRQAGEYARRKDQHFTPPKVAVPLFGRRQYVTEEVKPARTARENRQAWEAEKARSKALGRIYDRFYARRVKGRTRFFRAQDAGAVVFDLRKSRFSDIESVMLAYQGEGRAFVMIHALRREYKMKDGTLMPKGSHLGSAPQLLDDLDDPREFLLERMRKGELVYLRLTDPVA